MGQKCKFLGQEKSILGHYETNYGTKQVDFWGQEKLKLGHNKANYGGQNKMTIWDRRS
jgi:hypothetical protein